MTTRDDLPTNFYALLFLSLPDRTFPIPQHRTVVTRRIIANNKHHINYRLIIRTFIVPSVSVGSSQTAIIIIIIITVLVRRRSRCLRVRDPSIFTFRPAPADVEQLTPPRLSTRNHPVRPIYHYIIFIHTHTHARCRRESSVMYIVYTHSLALPLARGRPFRRFVSHTRRGVRDRSPPRRAGVRTTYNIYTSGGGEGGARREGARVSFVRAYLICRRRPRERNEERVGQPFGSFYFYFFSVGS